MDGAADRTWLTGCQPDDSALVCFSPQCLLFLNLFIFTDGARSQWPRHWFCHGPGWQDPACLSV